MRLTCVDDGVPAATIALLENACGSRGVDLAVIAARSFDYTTATPLSPGSLLFRPAVSLAAIRVEQFLFAAGVASFYADRDAVFFAPLSSPLLFERAGLPVPRTVPCASTDRALLRRFVDWLGGLPVVVKIPGGEGGVGVILVESLATLFSLVDYFIGVGRCPYLMTYVPDALHWRVLVVGDEAVAAYVNPIAPDDFRSVACADPADVTTEIDARLADTAVAAVRVLRTEFGGVDILAHQSGRLYLLESNFPCYFAHAQLLAGVDVAGRMIDHLLAKRFCV